ncbi:MAG: hypothetical protein ACD_79C01236G0003 [uncultured bacterium]|nr:MAG: hypothetical protein ACD_79C01236G0003 [uncultured bacterium]
MQDWGEGLSNTVVKIDIKQQNLTDKQLEALDLMWKESVRDILNCTSLAGCGHPGGSMSSINFLLLLYSIANISPQNMTSPQRDRVIVSHGHISPGLYSTLARFGFFNSDEMVLNYRKFGSRYAGHVESTVPGVEWNTGNLGQGISAAVGIAMAGKIKSLNYKTVVCMGDGEQQKGQISEARRVASKFNLKDLICIIDYNRYQIGGAISDVMPQNIIDNYKSDGWNVIVIENGHDWKQLFTGLKKAWNNEVDFKSHPTVIIANTIMGYGVSFMRNGYDYHGRALTVEEHKKAFEELKLENTLNDLKAQRKKLPKDSCAPVKTVSPTVKVNIGEPITYAADVMTDNRSAYGAALADLAKLNNKDVSKWSICGISCDLEGSVKMNAFRKISPENFIECGIQEHHSAVMSGSLSKEGMQVFFSTFGTFGVDEVFNQQRLNAFNKTNVKTVCTHLGLSVGEDGPTHQCIDYIGLIRNIPGYSIFIPADPNQTDHMIRYVASVYGNFFVGMGRAKTPVIANENCEPFFGKSYKFTPGKSDIIMQGNDACVIAIGPMLDYVLKVARALKNEKGLNIRVINAGSVVPFDRDSLIAAAKETKGIISVEDHYVKTGIGSIIDQILVENKIAVPVIHLGVKSFVESGDPEDLYISQGMGLEDIKKCVVDLISSSK